jgi:hypothetical protein
MSASYWRRMSRRRLDEMATVDWRSGRGRSAARATEAMLQALGGTALQFRITQGLVKQDTRGLGLTGQNLETVTISPALLRANADGTREVVVAGGSMAHCAESRGGESGLELADAIVGIESGGQLLRVTDVQAESFAGVVRLYRFTMESEHAEIKG